MRKIIIEKIFNFISRYPFFIIISSFVFGFLFFIAMQNLPLKSDFIDLLPQQAAPVKNIRFLSEKLKGVGQFSIVMESASGNTEGMKKVSDALYEKLSVMKELDFIQYKLPLEFIKQNSFFFIDTADLKTVYVRLREKVSYELWKNAPIYLSLEEDKAVEFNIEDIIDKYKNKKINVFVPKGEYFISNDDKMLAVFLKPGFMPTETDKTGDLMDKIKLSIKKIDIKKYGEDIKIFFGGTYALSYDQKNTIFNDIKTTSIIALLIVFIILLLFVRNFLNSSVLIYSLVIGVLSSFGIAFLVYHHINLITGFLIAILTGLGVNYGMHYLLRYNEEKRITNDKKSALKKAFINTLNPSFIGAVTTACSFLTLSFSKFLGFSEFGLLAGAGIMITLAAAYFIVTSFICITVKIKGSNRSRKILNQHSADKLLNGIPLNKTKGFSKYPGKTEKINEKIKIKFIIGVSFILIFITLIFLYKLKDLAFEYNSKKLEAQGQDSIKATELVQEKFNISTDPAIFYTYSRSEEKELYKKVSEMMKDENSLIGSVMTLSAILPDEKDQKEKIKWVKLINKEINSLPKNSIKDKTLKEKIDEAKSIARNVKVITVDDLPEGLKKRVVVESEGKTLYLIQVFPKKILFDAKEMRLYVDEIKKIKIDDKELYATGMHILYVYLIDIVFKESKIFITMVFFIIWLILLADLKSFKESFIALIPLVFGIIWLLLIMSIFKIKFNFMNIIVLPTVLGTGVDNGVHLYHRYKSSKNILSALKNTGFANFGMSLTVALGWLSLFFAHYEGLKTMGFVGVTGILTTFFASVTIMPAVLLFDEYFKNKKK